MKQIHSLERRRVNKVAANAAEKAVRSVHLVPKSPKVVPVNVTQRKRQSDESDVKWCVDETKIFSVIKPYILSY